MSKPGNNNDGIHHGSDYNYSDHIGYGSDKNKYYAGAPPTAGVLGVANPVLSSSFDSMIRNELGKNCNPQQGSNQTQKHSSQEIESFEHCFLRDPRDPSLFLSGDSSSSQCRASASAAMPPSSLCGEIISAEAPLHLLPLQQQHQQPQQSSVSSTRSERTALVSTPTRTPYTPSINEEYKEVEQEFNAATENQTLSLINLDESFKALEEAKRRYRRAQYQVEEADVRLHEANHNISEIELKLPGQWNNMYKFLLAYYARNGHCNVSQDIVSTRTRKRDIETKEEQDFNALARWVGNQRVFFKKHKNGYKTKLNQQRIDALDRLDFIWDLKGAKWRLRFDELLQFQSECSHCRVPTSYSAELSKWVVAQRYLWRRKREGKDLPHLTLEREEMLKDIDFNFEELGCAQK
jgi:hypothetical protein